MGDYIGGRIRELRKKRGMSIPELAAAVNLAVSTISNLESSPEKRVSLPVAEDIADALGVSVDTLLGRYEDEGDATTGYVTYSMVIQTENGPLQVFSSRPLNQAFLDAIEDAARYLGE